jgi:hypothetical protein
VGGDVGPSSGTLWHGLWAFKDNYTDTRETTNNPTLASGIKTCYSHCIDNATGARIVYMNKKQLLKAYEKGYIDDVIKQLRTYGTITRDHSFDIEDGYHAGAHRVLSIEHHGIYWDVELHNGAVKSVGYLLTV